MSESRPRPSSGVRIAVPDVSRHAHLAPGEMKAALKDVFRLGEQNIPAPPPPRTDASAVENKPTSPVTVALPEDAKADKTGRETQAAPSRLSWLKRWIPGRRQLIVLTLAGLLMGLPAAIAYWPEPPSDGNPGPQNTPADSDTPDTSRESDIPQNRTPADTTPHRDGPFLHDAAESAGDGSMVYRTSPSHDSQPGVARLEGVILKPELKASHDDPAIKLR